MTGAFRSQKNSSWAHDNAIQMTTQISIMSQPFRLKICIFLWKRAMLVAHFLSPLLTAVTKCKEGEELMKMPLCFT